MDDFKLKLESDAYQKDLENYIAVFHLFQKQVDDFKLKLESDAYQKDLENYITVFNFCFRNKWMISSSNWRVTPIRKIWRTISLYFTSVSVTSG